MAAPGSAARQPRAGPGAARGAGAGPAELPPPARRPTLTMATRSRPHHTSGRRGKGGSAPTDTSFKGVGGATARIGRCRSKGLRLAGAAAGRRDERASEVLIGCRAAAGSAAFSGNRKRRTAVREKEEVGQPGRPAPRRGGTAAVGPGRESSQVPQVPWGGTSGAAPLADPMSATCPSERAVRLGPAARGT